MHAELKAYFLPSLPAVGGRRQGGTASHKFAVGIIFNFEKKVCYWWNSKFPFIFMHAPHVPSARATDYSYHSPDTPESYRFHEFARIFFFLTKIPFKWVSANSKFKKAAEMSLPLSDLPEGFTASDILTSCRFRLCCSVFPSWHQIHFNKLALIRVSFLSPSIASPTWAVFWGWHLVWTQYMYT